MARSALLGFAALKPFLDQLSQKGALPNSAAKPAVRGGRSRSERSTELGADWW